MDLLAATLNFFGNPKLDRHRLLQGKWTAERIDHYESDAVSDNPLEHLLGILSESLAAHSSSQLPAVRALSALTSTAETCLEQDEFNNPSRAFWRGFQFVAEKAAEELNIKFTEITKEGVQAIILAGI